MEMVRQFDAPELHSIRRSVDSLETRVTFLFEVLGNQIYRGSPLGEDDDLRK